jgi:CubicO group peptidase (beta-lactamase class C family)
MTTMMSDNGAAYAAIDGYIERQLRRLHMPGAALAIVEGERIVHMRGFGRARPGGETPTPQTPFFIGSLTKSFTALAVMQLVEGGKVALDAPVQRYLPWFRVADLHASAQMTVRHLLNQTSGLPASAGEIPLTDYDAGPDAAERQAQALAALDLPRVPGAAFEYSNANYNLLGLIIAAVGGEPYADYVQTHILTPLGMNRTYTAAARAQRNGLAVGHRYWFSWPVAAPDLPIPHGSLAGGMLIATAEDMARWLIAQLNGGRYGGAQILSSAGIDTMQRGAAEVHAMGMALGRYAMGWYSDRMGGAQLLWHGGTLPHFGAYMALLPEQKRGVVLLFNGCQHWMTPVLTEFGIGVTALLAGAPVGRLPFLHAIPWLLRGLLLLPALQIADVAATLRRLRRPGNGSAWRPGLPSLLLNLLAALTLLPMLGKRRPYLRLYMPDYAWIALLCGCFALAWSVLRAGLLLFKLGTPDHARQP